MVRHDDPTGPLMCVMVAVGVVALVLAAGEGPDQRMATSSTPGLFVPESPATAGAVTGSAGGGSLDIPY